jgi:ubiquinone biosynthesis protein UbiJ
MDALETLLRPAAAMINRQIRATTPARQLCEQLDGRVFALRVPNTALSLYLIVTDGRLLMSGEYVGDPDVVVSGSPLSLARLAGPAAESLIRDGSIDISGDAVLAQQFRRLLAYGRPDLEEELSSVVGDVAAHGIGEAVRGIGAWSRQAGATMSRNVGEYLQEERRAVPGRYEVEGFRDDVNALRDDVARFEARLNEAEKGRVQ